MKRSTLVIVLLSITIAEVRAQSLRYSVSGGITYATVRYQSDFPSQIMWFDRHSNRTVNVGLNAELPVDKWMSVRIGIGYLQNGFSVNYDHFFAAMGSESEPNPFKGAKPDGTSDYVFHTLQAGGNLKIRPFRRGSPYIFAGPNLEYIMSAQYHAEYRYPVSGPGAGPLVTDNKSLNPAVHRFNLALDSGFGFYLAPGKVRPYVEFSYLLELTNMAKSGHLNQFYPFIAQRNWVPRSFLINVGITI